ncbi:Carboxypeptidase regulatory-like domain-containing protein [Candidatus Electrothrix marina]|uniref:Carboxypeptidase regulatory-like domain-containing protein n=1 Tax=Candidatus Electrothrix marina TaxID=1859130 RepID=A0A3S3QVV9_9BACT|nr:Carboxypeptidase regulatory-like domain-containing protein [Candidatus Electrothrix marina]RWX51456.1 Carboxypeptidase regulatory-like domain-containing protein [Candidatus Electrothrix marina]
MNSLINNTQMQNNIRTARSCLLLLIVCCCMVISNNAFAQYPDSSPYSSAQYQADIEATDSGGGTWGEILNMNARIVGSGAIFSITSKKGPFYNANSVSIRSGSHTGPIVAAGKVPPGSEAAKLQLDLSAVASFPHRFFATITNNVGYAWVGPIQISKNETATEVPVPWDDSQPVTQPANGSGSNGPQRPVISETPERAEINTAVNIAVTAGQTHSNDMVRVQCTASSSDNTPDAPYRSDWMYSGDTINIPLTFHSTGTQAVFCNTLDSYGATSSLSQRTITVTPGQSFAASPAPRREFSEPMPPPVAPARRRITSAPAPLVDIPGQGSVRAPISMKLIAGLDPQNRDLVRIGCIADDSDKTAADPYLSDWLPPKAETKGTVTFYSPGEKEIYCTSHSRQGATSPATRRTINIRYANQAPTQPEISAYPYNTDPGKTTYISVTAGSDPDGDMVKVQCSATDSNITGNAPYVSDWVAPQSTITAALAFYTSGDKEITCVTIDRKDARSDEATRKIHVHSSQYNPGYSPEHNFNNTSSNPSNNPSGSESCGCQQKNTSSYPMKSNARQEGDITFNRPYIPESPYRQSVFQAPEPQPDLKGRVVYRSNGSPAQNALIKVWDAMSGRAYTATTDYNGEFILNFTQKNLTGQIQATKGADTSAIREVRIKADQPAVIDLTVLDSASAQPTQQQWSPQPQWPARQAAPAQPMQQQWSPQSQWPAKQAAPARNSVWQFN